MEVSQSMKEAALKKLERCKTCTKPDEDGGCPGNQGIGCIGDWRCCAEMDDVCKDCKDHCKSHYLECEKTDCSKMNEYNEKKYGHTNIPPCRLCKHIG